MEKIKPGQIDTAVMDLISNIAAEDGLPTPAHQAENGSHHISGALTTTPPTTIKEHRRSVLALEKFCQARELCSFVRFQGLLSVNAATTQLTLKTPTADCKDKLLEFQAQHRHLLGVWGTAINLNFDILDPTAVVNPRKTTAEEPRHQQRRSTVDRGEMTFT
jgi:hypothetical protein